MFKLGTIGAQMLQKVNPRVKAIADLKNGYVFKVQEKYVASGVKSYATITVTGDTPVNGTIVFYVGDYAVYTTVVASTQDTAAKVATLIYTNAVAALTGYGYAVTNATPGVVKIVSPVYGSSTDEVLVDSIDVGDSAMTLTPAYTAGSLAASYPEAVEVISSSYTATDTYYVANNIVDTPELENSTDFVIEDGSYVRAVELNNLKGFPVEIDSTLVTTAYASVAADGSDYLVPDLSTPYKWVKADARGTSPVAIRVLEKTTFGGTGFWGKLC